MSRSRPPALKPHQPAAPLTDTASTSPQAPQVASFHTIKSAPRSLHPRLRALRYSTRLRLTRTTSFRRRPRGQLLAVGSRPHCAPSSAAKRSKSRSHRSTRPTASNYARVTASPPWQATSAWPCARPGANAIRSQMFVLRMAFVSLTGLRGISLEDQRAAQRFQSHTVV